MPCGFPKWRGTSKGTIDCQVLRTWNIIPPPGTHWSYALDPSLGKGEFGFTARGEKDVNMLYPYDGAPVRLEGKLLNLDTGRREDVQLIPMGSSLAILRRVTFPGGRPENR